MLRIVLPQGLTRTPAPVSAAPRAAAGGGGGGQPGGHGKGERASERVRAVHLGVPVIKRDLKGAAACMLPGPPRSTASFNFT